MKRDICIITTGGTIDKVYFDEKSSFEVGESTMDSVLLQANVSFGYRVVSLLKKDSLDIDDQDRELIKTTVLAQPEEWIIVTHGTDTMAESAKLLAEQQEKTVVFTGSMQPARFSRTDAIFNVGCAVAAVQILPKGAYIAINGNILDPTKAVKDRDNARFIEK